MSYLRFLLLLLLLLSTINSFGVIMVRLFIKYQFCIEWWRWRMAGKNATNPKNIINFAPKTSMEEKLLLVEISDGSSWLLHSQKCPRLPRDCVFTESNVLDDFPCKWRILTNDPLPKNQNRWLFMIEMLKYVEDKMCSIFAYPFNLTL